MRKINNKKGSHVEIVISFAIFVTFLVFMYSILEPAVKKPKSKEYILESTKSAIMDYLMEEVLVYSLRIDEDEVSAQGGSCFAIASHLINTNVTVKNGDNVIDSRLTKEYDSLNTQEYDQLSILYYSNDYTVYLSKEFGVGTYPSSCNTKLELCTPSTPDDERCYTLTKIGKEDHIFKSKIEKMRQDYDTQAGLNSLRNMIGIPAGTEFYFELLNLSRDVLVKPDNEPKIDENINLYIEEFPISFIDENNDPGNKQGGFFVVKVW
jgi:hypothetical protein